MLAAALAGAACWGANMQTYMCDTVQSCSVVALARLAALYVNKEKKIFLLNHIVPLIFFFFNSFTTTPVQCKTVYLLHELSSNPGVTSSNYCLGRRGCRSLVMLNAYTTAWCTEPPAPEELEARTLHRDGHWNIKYCRTRTCIACGTNGNKGRLCAYL